VSALRDPGPLLRFLLVGGTTVLLDGLSYALLTRAGMGVETAKALGFLIGAAFAYVANWRFTFGARRSRWSELLFVAVYALALVLNVAVNSAVRGWLHGWGGAAALAFLAATGVSAAWNFTGMSLFVFSRGEAVRGHAAG
jgi:putative flippase GtrA